MGRVGVLAIFLFVSFLTAEDGNPQPPQVAAWAALDKGLHAGDLDYRRQAAIALSTIGASNQEAVNRLVETLKNDKSVRVRMQAALALGEMKATQAIPALKDALEDSTEVAFAAAKALTDLGDQGGQGMLVAVLSGERKDTPGIMTNARREAEKRIRHPEGLLLMGAEDATGAMFGPAAMGLEAFKDASDLNGKGAPGRAAAAAYLAKDPDPYAVTLLEWALGDDSSYVRVEAAKALGQRGNAASVTRLVPLLQDKRNSVRTMAAASIIRLIP
jgi:HEAT repeat protein